MSIGFHDSVLPDGPKIRKDRESLGISREALSKTSSRAFSEKTLARAESGGRISKEKLRAIANSLGFEPERYLPEYPKSVQTNGMTFNIHHWEDEYREFISLSTSLKIVLEDILGCTIFRETVVDDKMAALLIRFTIEGRPDCVVNYIFYDNPVKFTAAISQRYTPKDIVLPIRLTQVALYVVADAGESLSCLDRIFRATLGRFESGLRARAIAGAISSRHVGRMGFAVRAVLATGPSS